jgi:hypothetical protein
MYIAAAILISKTCSLYQNYGFGIITIIITARKTTTIIIIIIIIMITTTTTCKTLGIETTENWYSHIPKLVCQHDITVLWNQGIQTDREVLANRPNIIIKNMKDKICLLIDIAIPSDRSIIQKESEKKLKYKNLSIEIQRIWNMKRFVILVIIGATGIVTRGLKRYLEMIPGKHSIDSLQKTAVLGT